MFWSLSCDRGPDYGDELLQEQRHQQHTGISDAWRAGFYEQVGRERGEEGHEVLLTCLPCLSRTECCVSGRFQGAWLEAQGSNRIHPEESHGPVVCCIRSFPTRTDVSTLSSNQHIFHKEASAGLAVPEK